MGLFSLFSALKIIKKKGETKHLKKTGPSGSMGDKFAMMMKKKDSKKDDGSKNNKGGGSHGSVKQQSSIASNSSSVSSRRSSRIGSKDGSSVMSSKVRA